MSMTYVRGTIVPYLSFNNSQHVNLSYTTPSPGSIFFETNTYILIPPVLLSIPRTVPDFL